MFSAIPPVIYLLIAFVCFLLWGLPIAVALLGSALLLALVGVQLSWISPHFLSALPLQLFDLTRDTSLLSIPFLSLLGFLFVRSGLIKEALDSAVQLLKPIPGSLAYITILIGALMASSTSVYAASLLPIGLMLLPSLLQHRYSPSFSTGLIAAAGSLAYVIPPSAALILIANQIGYSVSELYRSALMPGLILIGLYIAWIAFFIFIRPAQVRAVPEVVINKTPLDFSDRFKAFLKNTLPVFILLIGMPVAIWAGRAPYEIAATSVLAVLVFAWSKKSINRLVLLDCLKSALYLSAAVMLIVIASRFFQLIFYGLDGNHWIQIMIAEVLKHQVSPMACLIAVNVLIFVLGFFIEPLFLLMFVTPLLLPFIDSFGIDRVLFGVLLALNTQSALMRPPFGFSLFYLRLILPASIQTKQMYRGALPFVFLQIVVLILVMAFPGLVTYEQDLLVPDGIPLQLGS